VLCSSVRLEPRPGDAVCGEQSEGKGGSGGLGSDLGTHALAGDLLYPRLSLLSVKHQFPPCPPVQKRGLPGVGVAGSGPGGRAPSGAF